MRRAKPDDALALAGLHVASWRETYSGVLPAQMLAGLSVGAREAGWARILAEADADGSGVWVAEDAGAMVGFGAFGRQRDPALADAGFTGEIGALYVLRSHQGGGLGRSIMKLAAKALLDRAHRAAALWVLRENTGARGFYDRLGGETVGEKADERAHATLVEVAYGWRDLRLLAEIS